MTQTIVMACAALQLVGVACYVSTHRPLHVLFLQFTPVTLALLLSVIAFGKFMGWPV